MTAAISAGADDTVKLKVLFIGGYDSTNHALVGLISEMRQRGHVCTVLADNISDTVNNSMLLRSGVPLVSLSAFPLDSVGEYDVAFAGPFMSRGQRALYRKLATERVLIVSFSNLFTGVSMRVPADLVITMSESKFEEFENNGLRYRMVAVGSPQYDRLIAERDRWRELHGSEIRSVLIVDQGAFPLGITGKRQLADKLIEIAQAHPDVTFRVKPRYVPGEYGDHLHSSADHLFSHLEDRPENLTLLSQGRSVEELVLEHDAMITTWSTAHLSAAVLGMPLLLLEGLESEDVFDVRSQRVAWAYDTLRKTGCVVDIRTLDVQDLPFAVVDSHYVRQEFAEPDVECAPRIARLVEAFSARVTRERRALCGWFALGYSEFMDRLARNELETCAAGSPEDVRAVAHYHRINPIMQDLVFDHRSMGFALEMERMAPAWQLPDPVPSAKEADDAHVREVKEMALALKARYFEAHPEQVGTDLFIQDQYFDWLYATGQHAALLHYEGPVVAPESLAFERGRVWLKRRRLLRAARAFVESFDISLRRPVRALRKNKNIAMLMSQSDRRMLAQVILALLGVYHRYDALSGVETPARSGFEALAYHRVRALSALGRTDEARGVCSAFRPVLASPKATASTGLGDLPLRVSVRAYRLLLAWRCRSFA